MYVNEVLGIASELLSPWNWTPANSPDFLGPHPALLPQPTDEANRCNLRHVTPKTLQKALYVGFVESGRPPQVVCFGWSQFPVPETRFTGCAGPICRLTPCHSAFRTPHFTRRPSGFSFEETLMMPSAGSPSSRATSS